MHPPDEREGQRIDNFLLTSCKKLSRSGVYSLLRKGKIQVHRRRVPPHYRLKIGDEISVPLGLLTHQQSPPLLSASLRAQLTRAVLYEDQLYMVISKPAGLASHGGSNIKIGLIESLRALYADQYPQLELAHRLDRGTSGCVVIAKTRAALLQIHEYQRTGQVKKSYLAMCSGHWSQDCVIEKPISFNGKRRGMRAGFVTNEGGQWARTHFAVCAYTSDSTWLSITPDSGRMHQIRIHALYAGHPLIGDDLYGDWRVNRRWREHGMHRLFLHACAIQWPHVFVRAPCPNDIFWVAQKFATI